MKKDIVLILFIFVFLFGCVDFSFNPKINININETGFANETTISEEDDLILNKFLFNEIFAKDQISCVLNEGNEKFNISKDLSNVEILFEKTEFFVTVEKINCDENKCVLKINNISKDLDYSFLDTIKLIYEDYEVECVIE
jgi:hypothetical protein